MDLAVCKQHWTLQCRHGMPVCRPGTSSVSACLYPLEMLCPLSPLRTGGSFRRQVQTPLLLSHSDGAVKDNSRRQRHQYRIPQQPEFPGPAGSSFPVPSSKPSKSLHPHFLEGKLFCRMKQILVGSEVLKKGLAWVLKGQTSETVL